MCDGCCCVGILIVCVCGRVFGEGKLRIGRKYVLGKEEVCGREFMCVCGWLG